MENAAFQAFTIGRNLITAKTPVPSPGRRQVMMIVSFSLMNLNNSNISIAMMKALRSLMLALTVAVACSLQAQERQYGIKTNLLYDATATINLGAEMSVAPKWSVDLSGNLNAWDINDHKWKHWMLQPEARYWFCDALLGHFVGAHLLGGQYNVGNIDLGDTKFLGTDFSNLKDTATRDGMSVPAWPTVTPGRSDATGTSRPSSA